MLVGVGGYHRSLVKELLEGRRFGFALRPPLAHIALGLGIAVTLADALAWGGWGVRETNALLVGSAWLAGATALVSLLGLATALAEWRDIPEEEATIARLDVIGGVVVTLVYAATTALRVLDTGAAAPSPLALLLALAGLIVLLAGAAMASVLYAEREWEEIEEFVPVRHRRRRA
jgi:hypothetical protein